MQIERDAVVEPDALVVNRLAAYQAKTERDDLAALPPDEKTRAFRHLLSNGPEIILGQPFKFQWRPLVDGQIQRIDFIDPGRDVGHDLHLDLRRSRRLTEFSAQIFPGRLA